MPHADATDGIQDAPEYADLFTGAFTVRIAALSPQRVIAATVTPLNLGTDEPELTAVVSWEGLETVSSSVRIEVEPGPAQFDPWLRFLLLLWAVLGPKTLPEAEAFGPGRWTSVVLSTQELDGALHHSVVVVVDRVREAAWLVRSDPTRHGAEVEVSASMLKMDAGTLLTEMVSKLILERAWL